jgi:hypothetical protein
MIWIEITNSVVGRAALYSELRKQGQWRYVHTYRAHMSLADGSHLTSFAVTRDSSVALFAGTTERYGKNCECPPSRPGRPYHAVIHDKTELFPFGLRLYEPEYRNQYHLRGEGPDVRSAVMFHHGPAKTEGCFTVAGGVKGFSTWKANFLTLYYVTPIPEIRVWVQPREIPHYLAHLAC